MNYLNHLRTFQFALACGATLFTLSEAKAMLADPIEGQASTGTRKPDSTSHYLNERSSAVLLEQISALRVLVDEQNTTRQEKDDYEAEICLLSSSLDLQEAVEADEAKVNMFSVTQLAQFANEDDNYSGFYQKVLRAQQLGIEEFRDEKHLDALIAAHVAKETPNNK